MSASTSCRPRAARLLDAARRGELPANGEIREIGENCPREFFRDVIEPLGDSFDPAQAQAYDQIMRAWIPAPPPAVPAIPPRVGTVYVLSRVTLGADIKIVSPMLGAMKKRFPDARIIFVANRKSAELFAADSRIEHLHADYPRSGPVSHRVQFARELAAKLDEKNAILLDPDSRITQLGLLPVFAADRSFHFPSRTLRQDGADNLSDLVGHWLRGAFGLDAPSYIAPPSQSAGEPDPRAAVSLGVGENESKRVGGDFESRLIAALGEKYQTIWVDRGVGGPEASRVTAAVEASGAAGRVRYWEGSFAGFASIISQCNFYAGYDSAGQHAAAAAGIPLLSIFAGAPSERFRTRWSAAGPGLMTQVVADGLSPEEVWKAVVTLITPDPLE